MTRFTGILLATSTLMLFSCNQHFSDVNFNSNGRISEGQLFDEDFSEPSTPVFFNNKNEVRFLNKYPFDKGGYAIVGLQSESNPNDLQNEMGDFFTDDVSVLNEFKTSWTFSKESVIHTSDYHYIIYITRHGQILESFAVNLNSNVIAAGKGYFYFDSKKLSQFKNLVKKPKPDYQEFSSVSEGRDYFSRIIDDKNLVLAYDPIWMNFEGKFTFTFKSSNQKWEPATVLKRVKENLKKNFPNEQFLCSIQAYWTNGEYEFEINCNKNFFDKFNLYTKEKDWEAYEVSLVTFWKD